MSKVEVNEIDKQSGSTLTIGGSGTTVQLGTGASQTGFGREGSVNWQTGSIKTAATFSAVSGEGYFVDTSSNQVTANLPAGSAGAIVAFSDYARNFNTNNLVITPNGSEKIGGVSASLRLTVDGQALTLVYVDSTKGWVNVQNAEDTEAAENFISASGGTEVTDGNFKLHIFTGPGTFTVSSLASTPSRNDVDYVVVGGGGGAGAQGGGGGAGGYRESPGSATCYTASPLGASPATAITVTATAFPITVGGGGSATPQNPGAQGNSSVFSTITSAGGGFGGGGPGSAVVGGNGGSGGGSGGPSPTCSFASAGTGNTPPVSPAQGTNGGQSKGGAGGGALVAAGGPGPAVGGAGAGVKGFGTSGESGPNSSYYFSGGGGGGKGGCAPFARPGGIGGAGNNYYVDCGATIDATANTGGGGGGDGGDGGSGIVIIRYKFQ